MTVSWGLDLGISSVGWAVASCDGKDSAYSLMDWGCRIFEPGLDGTTDKVSAGKGESRCTIRRMAKAMRVQYERRRARKAELLELLRSSGWMPDGKPEKFFSNIDARLLKSLPADAPVWKAHVLPYILRSRALDFDLSPAELARVLYHLAQRRGYKSNRKEEAKNEEETGVVKAGIAGLRSEIENSGTRTLGEYFSNIDPEHGKIRRRYTDRSMFEAEFRLICARQRKLISHELEEKLYNAIFFQRKLKSCKNLVGKCRLEPECRRCSYLRPEAQRFRLLTAVGDLRVQEFGGALRPLNEDERAKAIAALDGLTGELDRSGNIKLTRLGKLAGLPSKAKFTLGEDEKSVTGNQLNAIAFRVFGERAAAMSAGERDNFIQRLNSIEDTDALRRRLQTVYKLDDEHVNLAVSAPLPDDYCNFSLRAILRLLPDLEAGVALNTIIKLQYPEHGSHAVHDLLPIVDELDVKLRNPVVHRTLAEMRRVVNALLAKYGKPDIIRVELARDLKSNNKEREQIIRRIAENERERAAIAERITQKTSIVSPSNTDILKVRLADECNWECPYTGQEISIGALLSGNNFQIEHILPYSRSFDDTFANKTLCRSEENGRKGERSPYEAYSGAEYEAILERVGRFKSPWSKEKLERFKCREFDASDFLNRSLNDTRYASKLAMEYLGMLFGGTSDGSGRLRVQATTGQLTALLRRSWGANYLLGTGEKERGDHRHHAIDALTIAISTPALVKQAASVSAETRRELLKEKSPLIETSLYEQAKAKLDDIIVSHRVVVKAKGAFHKETIYGRDFGNDIKHIRVRLSDLEEKEVDKIVDEKIRTLVRAALDRFSIDDPKKVFADAANLPVLTDAHGSAVNTIKCVRVARTTTTRAIGKGDGVRNVANGANHHLAIYAILDGSGREVEWRGEIVSVLDARLRLQHGEPLIRRDFGPGTKFKFSLSKGDIVEFTCRDGVRRLCVVRGIALPQFQLTPLNDARLLKEVKASGMYQQPTLSNSFKCGMKKYSVDPLGKLRPDND